MSDPPALHPDQAAALTRRVTLYSVSVASILLAIKIAAWWVSGSVSLLASLADSALDLMAALGTFFAVRYAQAPPDQEHRFGHGKAEAFASLLQAGLVFASAALIGREGIADLFEPHPLKATGWAIAAMLVSVVLTALLVTAQTRVLRQASSVAVSGDRAHYIADLGSNVLALAGIGASAALGYNSLDALGGLAVAALLLWGAISVFREASSQLMDRELSDEARARIVALLTQDPKLTDVHQLRTRASGPYIHMQMHVDLDPELTLDAAHQVLVAAEKRVLEAFPQADIIIHADPRGRAEPHGGAFSEVHAETPEKVK
jgi:cation diffusion facilitator family transporter